MQSCHDKWGASNVDEASCSERSQNNRADVLRIGRFRC